MNCQTHEAQIGDYVDGTLDETQRPSLESHLATCASCRALVADFSVIRSASLELEAQVPPPHVWRNIAAAIENEPKPLLGFGGTQWWRAFAPVAAMTFLVVGMAWTAGRLTPVATERLARVSPAAQSEPVSIVAEYKRAEQDLQHDRGARADRRERSLGARHGNGRRAQGESYSARRRHRREP
jgi:anti-sigma factor RsiW